MYPYVKKIELDKDICTSCKTCFDACFLDVYRWDDAEESPSGAVSLTSSDLELVDEGANQPQTVGVRFVGVDIPQGATVLGAYVQFKVDEVRTDGASLTVEGQAADDALVFTAEPNNVSTRLRTAASVTWTPSPWGTVGEAGPDQRTPDLSAVIQEIVDRSGWSAGNALAIVFTGSGKRVAESYNGEATAAPLLHGFV